MIIFALMINDWMDLAPNASESVARVQANVLEALQQ